MADERYPWSVPPQDGEMVCGCGHTPHTITVKKKPDPANPFQWFEMSQPVEFVGPGETFSSRWIVTCQACYTAAGHDARRVELREHWTMGEAVNHHARLLQLHGDAEKIENYLHALDDVELLSLRGRLPARGW